MGIFRRWPNQRPGRGHPAAHGAPTAPLPGLPMFTDGDRGARFCALARQVFAEHGLECRYHDGFLKGADGRSYGLTNVALLAAHEPERGWTYLLEAHVQGIVAAHATPRQREMATVRDRLYLRLWHSDELPVRPRAGEPLGDGLLGLASIDHPEHIETLTGDHDIDLLGGWPAVREVALGNLSRLRADEVVDLGDDPQSQVQLSVGGFFNASRVLTMNHLLREDFLIEDPSYGVLFVVPNRHLVAVHPLSGPGMVGATTTLVRLARGESPVPGAISPHLWFWRDGLVQRVSHEPEAPVGQGADPTGGVVLRVEGLLEQAMRELGMVEDS